jgi:two-component system LytT family response regulator
MLYKSRGREREVIRVLVVDDEQPARERLIRLLESMEGVELVGEAADGLAALEAIAAQRPDLVFLDIEMPELNGLEVARSLGPDGPAIVFATAYDQYALEAFDAAAVDYLVKPIAKDRLAAAIDRARSRGAGAAPLHELLGRLGSAQQPVRMAVRTGNRYAVFDPSQISAVLAQDHYANILCGGRELLSDESLDVIAARLDAARFVRVHRSAIINLDYLGELERLGDRKYVAVLSDPARTRVPVSRDRLPALKKRLGLG